MSVLKIRYASMSDADIEQELNNNILNLEYCKELWIEQDRRVEEANMMIEARQF
jgi:hypothetical protein